METLGYIGVIILLVFVVSLIGVAGKIMGAVGSLLADVVSDGLGNCLGCLVWPLIIFIVIGALLVVL